MYLKLQKRLDVLIHFIAIVLISYSYEFDFFNFRTFVIEKQPPQVMKTNTRFTATVRLLVGVMSHIINIQNKRLIEFCINIFGLNIYVFHRLVEY